MKEYKELPEDVKLVKDPPIGIIGTPNGLGKQAKFMGAIRQLKGDDKTNVIVVGHHPNGKTTCTAEEYIDWKSRKTFDRSVPHLGSSAGMLHHSDAYKLTNTYEKLDEWDYNEDIKASPMGGETKSSKQQFEKRVKRNRKRNKNKKTHRK